MAERPLQKLVLDSWPMLEWVKGRPAGGVFLSLMERAEQQDVALVISRMNYGEVIYISRKELKLSADQVGRLIGVFDEIPIEIVSATDSRVDVAIRLKSEYNISYADAFAAGLAIELGCPLVTGDPEFRDLEADGALALHWVGA